MYLDNDWGTYPFVTASTVLTGGANAGCGIPPMAINRVIGVMKAYTTRVGAGPFPTELMDDTGVTLQKVGQEFGATTGRARRCGWLDLVMIRFAAQINGYTDMALTKLDILDEFEEIKICTGYTLKEKTVDYFDCDAYNLFSVKPVYRKVKGWKQSTRGITEYEKLPDAAKNYIREIKEFTGVPVGIISTGPERREIIVRQQFSK